MLEAKILASELFHQLTLAAPEQRAVVWELAVCRQRRAPKEPTTATGRAGGDGLRRAPLEQSEAGGDFFRLCKTVAQDAPLCALACNMLAFGAALE